MQGCVLPGRRCKNVNSPLNLFGRKYCGDSKSQPPAPSARGNTYTPPGPLGSDACRTDSCCVWDFIQRELFPQFIHDNGTCTALARAAVRVGFHDAGAWSTTSGFGGADGSLLLNANEIDRPENNGLQDIRSVGLGILQRYQEHGIGAADLVQFMHNVATVVCPRGPRILTFVGREDSDADAPTGLIPSTQTDPDFLIELFQNKTINAVDLGSLLGAHTVAQQFFADPSRAGMSLDSTPGVWDVSFYSELLASNPPE
ncbi:hypothetical protein LTR93_011315 [Exophiala xenobiotica]|nr:hypothetical protein LTR93_011315 [Exophiala xenobiotica]